MRKGSFNCHSASGGYLKVLLGPAALALLLGIVNPAMGAGARSAGAQPEGLEAMRALALELMRVQDYDGSIAVYREIAAQMPDDFRSHYDLAAALSFVQRYEEAAPEIREAIRLKPGNLQSLEMASLIFFELRWYEEAFEATLRVAGLGEPTAMYSLVNMYEKGLGVRADADEALRWAVRAAEHGHLGAMAFLVDVFGNGRLGQRADPARAEAWAKRLELAESAQK